LGAAGASGAVVSYDLNYRPSIWKAIGGAEHAIEVNRRLAGLVDVMFGNEEDFHTALGYKIEGAGSAYEALDTQSYASLLARVSADYPNLKVVATSLRRARSASFNGWGGICFAGGRTVERQLSEDVQILDRVGGGDSFASGVIYGLLTGLGREVALEYGVAHGALAMTTPGDTSMATLAEVKRLAQGRGARVER
jgi:2-dehydro-3-deoxygluconokinase